MVTLIRFHDLRTWLVPSLTRLSTPSINISYIARWKAGRTSTHYTRVTSGVPIVYRFDRPRRNLKPMVYTCGNRVRIAMLPRSSRLSGVHRTSFPDIFEAVASAWRLTVFRRAGHIV